MTTILVVDDSRVARSMAAALLEEQGDWVVAQACAADQAVMMVQLAVPDLVISDLQMPGTGGLQLLKQLKGEHPLLPVVVMTGHGSEETAVAALQQGADGYITKRRLTTDLVRVVSSILDAVQEDRKRRYVLKSQVRQIKFFEIENDPPSVSALVRHVIDEACRAGAANESDRIRLSVSLEEALLNAIVHGNLEVDSGLREAGDGAFERLIARRRGQQKYARRRVRLTCDLRRNETVFIIRDEGPGFDVRRLADPRDPEQITRASGRGVLLMKSFMDEVEYSDRGTVVTMTKRSVEKVAPEPAAECSLAMVEA